MENEIGQLKQYKEKLAEYEKNCLGMTQQILELTAKVDDLENRSRRNNLAIYGVTEEPDEDSKSLQEKVQRTIFTDILDIAVKSVERIHRVGNPRSERPRPIVLRLLDFSEKSKILSCCNKLKGTEISISEDFSKRVRDVRSQLWRSAADEKAQGAKVSLVFDKLKVDGKMFVWDPVQNSRVEVAARYSRPKAATKARPDVQKAD
ncbi:hypothetical protein HPB48_010825 [Haemaphysalis longicornis]|uniref:Uncharacterized protein n=1 Tax=Haemaphysalis longicornis TaxID=44386 RepID=A0A9J6GWU1_HAELO|nr:hypothetical protein HPB48_010825 [Haemaphysalis longicornis]